uniref:Bystin n=1 Tax=Heterosigma akashiwo TaxID=2829 RepID=A0A6V1WMU3_HETAK|mmetsp:Transcript_6231/g.10088  ORF Transcript_6231/g.10088 Transcript_6231/m.10088 type:complete len:449 (-) Transcript_6231:398-1744(-)
MGRFKKDKKGPTLRHKPIGKEIESAEHASKFVVEKHWKKKPDDGKGSDEDEAKDAAYVDARLTRKILDQARSQREEMTGKAQAQQKMVDSEQIGSDSEDEFEVENTLDLSEEEEEELVEINDGYVGDAGLSQSEERLVESFMTGGLGQRRTLADIIMGKIREKEMAEALGAQGGGEEEPESALPPKVVQVYSGVGKLLSRYRSGKLPKAFKIVPALSNWEEVLWLTRPDTWTPQATYAATKLMASNCDPASAQRFYQDFLLEKVRDDIRQNKKLNYHLYNALLKACYKPAAFYKGILLPLARGGDCTLQEATIVGSVLTKKAIPVNHSAVALLKLAQGKYSGAASLFIKLLLNKKYCLPYRVVDALCAHFLAFASDSRELPVLWHQSLLTFAQRYKHHLTREQKEALKPLLKAHFHRLITPEVRRELYSSRSRGEAAAPEEEAMIMQP